MSSLGSRRSVAVTGLALVLASGAAGSAPGSTEHEPEPARDEPDARAAIYETATVFARPVSEATAAVTVLEREEIEALGVVTVAELLRQIPGVDVTSGGPRGATATAQIRGGDPNFTLVLVDGVPLNDATDTFGGSVNLHSLPVEHVERVEVVRGPLSSFYGSTGLAGAIHVITRRDAPRLTAALGAGDSAFVEGAASLAGHGEAAASYFVGLSWNREKERVADDRFEQLQLRGRAEHAAGSGSLRWSGRLAVWDARDYPDASGGPRLGSGETRRSDHDEVGLGVEWTYGPTERQRLVWARVYRHRLERESPGVPASVPPSFEQTTFLRAQAGWAHPVVAAQNERLTLGLAVDWERGRNESVLLLPPDPGVAVDGSYRAGRAVGGLLVEYAAERGRLLWEAGARLDAPEGFAASFSPSAGLVYRLPDGATRLRAHVGRAFKLPSFFALSSPTALGGNPDLEPEIAIGWDAAVERAFDSARLTASLGLFDYRYEDLIDFDFDSFRNVNRSEVRSRGAELSLRWRAGAAWTLQAHVTRQDVEDRETRRPLRNRPDWIAAARVVWRPDERLRWELDHQLVSERADRQIPAPERETVAGYPLWGTAAAYRLTPTWEIRARVDNLADKDYETWIGFPGPGRSFRVGLRFGGP